MPRERAIIQIPPALALELDKIAGPGHRSELATEILSREIRRVRLLELLKNREPIWKDGDHPELAQGTEAWVRDMRRESDARLQRKAKSK